MNSATIPNRSSVLLLALLVVAGCSAPKQFAQAQPKPAPKPAGGWSNWTSIPRPEAVADTFVYFQDCRTFTILPYSSIGTDAVLGGRDENSTMFALASGVEERGYRYVDNIDSADFVLIEQISADYDSAAGLRNALRAAPEMKFVKPFSLITSPFGAEADRPLPLPPTTAMWHPLVKIFAYTNTGRLLTRWASGGNVTNQVLPHVSQYVMRQYPNGLPMSLWDSKNIPLGEGRIGIRMMMWSRDGFNYWPEITEVLPNSPAADAGLRNTDMILEINGVSTRNIDFRELIHRIRGDVGQKVMLKIMRWSDPVRTIELQYRAQSN